MSNLPNSVIRLVPPTLRGGYCPDSWQEFANELVCGTQAQHSAARGTTFYNFGNTAPYPPTVVPPPVIETCPDQDFLIDWEPSGFALEQYALFYTEPKDPQLGGVTAISLCATEYQNIGAYETFRFDGVSTLETIDFPVATRIGQQFWVANCPALTSISAPAVTTLDDIVLVTDNAALTTISFPVLVTANLNFLINRNNAMTQIEFPALVTSGRMLLNDNTSLATFNAPSWLPEFNVSFSGCALDETSVDHILARCVAGPIGTVGPTVRSINLSGGTNSAPSAGGLVDKATLAARPFLTVTTN